MYKYAAEPDFYNRSVPLSIRTDIGSLEIQFPAKRMGIVKNKPLEEKLYIDILPFFLDNERYYYLRIKITPGKTYFRIATDTEYRYQIENIIDGISKSSKADISELKELLSIGNADVSVIDREDKAVLVVKSFLEEQFLFGLLSRMERMLEADKFIETRYDVPVAGAVRISEKANVTERAWQILKGLIEQPVLSAGTRDEDFLRLLEREFKSCISRDVQEDNTSLFVMQRLFSIDLEIKDNGSEGGIRFSEDAFETIIDLSDISYADCREEGVVEDVKKAFRRVAVHDLRGHNNKMYGQGRPLLELGDVPGTGDKLQFGELSDHIIPTASAGDNGVIEINDNFLKILYLLKKMGAHTDKGDIYETNELGEFSGEKLGNLYYSLIYSIALHETRGHYWLKNGVFVLNADENYAQAVRGKSYRKVNLIATVFFWLAFIENGKRADDRDKVRNFLNENPSLVSGLSREEVSSVAGIASSLLNNFYQSGLFDGVPYNRVSFRPLSVERSRNGRSRFTGRPRESVFFPDNDSREVLSSRASSGTSWEDISRTFEYVTMKADAGRTLEIRDVAVFLGGDENDKSGLYFERAVKILQMLEKFGLLERFIAKSRSNGKLVRFKYRAVRGLSGLNMPLMSRIKEEFSGVRFPPEASDLNITKGRIRGILRAAGKGRSLAMLRDPENFTWSSAAAVLKWFYGRAGESSPEDIVKSFPAVKPAVINKSLVLLNRAGVLIRNTGKFGRPFYSLQRMSERDHVSIVHELMGMKNGTLVTNMDDLYSRFMLEISSVYHWDNMFRLLPLIVAVDKVEKIIHAEGFDAFRNYDHAAAVREIDEIKERNGAKDLDELVEKLNKKYRLMGRYEVIFYLRNRLEKIRNTGKMMTGLQYQPSDIRGFIRVLSKRSSEAAFKNERAFSYLTGLLMGVDEKLVGPGMVVLERSGLLEKSGSGKAYSVNPHLNLRRCDDIRSYFDTLSGRSVEPEHLQVIKTLAEEVIRPGWAMTMAVLSQLYGDHFSRISGKELILGNGYHSGRDDKHSVIKAVRALSRTGLVAGDIKTTRLSDFLNEDFRLAIDLHENEYRNILEVMEKMPSPQEDADLLIVRRKIALECLDPCTRGAFYFFRDIREISSGKAMRENGEGFLSMSEIKETFGALTARTVEDYIELFCSTGLLIQRGKMEKDDNLREYMPVPLTDRSMEDLKILLEIDNARLSRVDKDVLTGRILELTEPGIARAFSADMMRSAGFIKGSKDTNIVIAIETDWIPGSQRGYIQKLLDGMAELYRDSVTLIRREDHEDLLAELGDLCDKGEFDMSNVILLTERKTLEEYSFWDRIKGLDPERKAFIAGIDPRNIGDRTYIRIVDMIRIALLRNFGDKRALYGNIDIVFSEDKNCYILIPNAEKVDLEAVKEVYQAVLHAQFSA
jgi:hypothetical protein